ncbi:MAG TPA: hypothetical protein VLS89_13400, partial [Candidatus Nanopelagicales bacterium]|nr:hypothetical protein [Candidatus Nanopelagicales bacterium]
RASGAGPGGVDRTRRLGRSGMFYTTVEEGQRVLKILKSGQMEIIEGPRRVWRWGARFEPMAHYVAHPGEFLIVRFRDGQQEHLPGPTHVWLDPRVHLAVEKEDVLQIGSKEAVVVYSQKATKVARRLVHGPASFVPEPGEWLHTFSWHGSAGGAEGFRKIPNGLVFQKLWLMPDQMYHDVPDVRTADDAVLTIRLMLFFELIDIERMLATTHDPIGDFVNAATSDVVEFVGKHRFEDLKQNAEKLNDLATYKQLTGRADQCGYHIEKVVYRGYGAPASLQQMHDQAIESRTRLALERATEQQAQELEDFRQDRQLARARQKREEHEREVAQEIKLQRQHLEAELAAEQARRNVAREQAGLDAEQEERVMRARDAVQREHLGEIGRLGVDLTRFLTQGRADQVIELRGGGAGAQIHLPASPGAGAGRKD